MKRNMIDRLAFWLKWHCWLGPWQVGSITIQRLFWQPSRVWYWANYRVEQWHERRVKQQGQLVNIAGGMN